jgi:hypothetical protein
MPKNSGKKFFGNRGLNILTLKILEKNFTNIIMPHLWLGIGVRRGGG